MNTRVAALEAQDVYVKADVDQQISDAQDAAEGYAKTAIENLDANITSTGSTLSVNIIQVDGKIDTITVNSAEFVIDCGTYE